jgi:hypothetical protein
MKPAILLTDEIRATMPETINILHNFGNLQSIYF